MAAHPDYMEEMFSQITLDRTGALAHELPMLTWNRSGSQTSVEVIAALLKTLKVTGPVMESGTRRTSNRTVFGGQRDKLRQDLKHLNADVTPESAHAFGQALWALWEKKRFDFDLAWLAWGAGFFGDDAMTLAMYAYMQQSLKQGKRGYILATQTLNVLMSIDTPMARMTLASYAHSARSNALQKKAMAFVEGSARREGVSIQRLEDLSIPSCGLDARGQRVFSYGTRTFAVGVGANFYPVVRDEAGKMTKNLPRPRKSDDAEQVERAREQWDILKGSLLHTFKIQSRRLEQMMIARRRWTLVDWDEFMRAHPVMTLFARNLLWQAHTPDGEQLLYRVAEDSTLATVDDEPFEVPPGSEVTLVHPLDMTEGALQRWGDVFMDYELIAPFEQLGRPSYRHATQAQTFAEVIEGVELDPRKLRIFMKYGDFDSEFAHQWRTNYFKRLLPYDVSLKIILSPGLQVGGYDQDVPQKIKEAYLETPSGEAMDRIEPMAYSEGWRTLLGLIGHSRT